VVHVNAATAALVAALVVGPRRDWGRQALLPHSVPLVVLGAGLLWFGFNAGSALAANASAALAFANTMLAPLATLAVWMALDGLRTGRATAVGAATAIVVGLVAVTPAARFVAPCGALALGALAALPSYFGLLLRARTRLDDSLDVVAAHGLGGASGALLTGVFASRAWGSTTGLLEGNAGLVGRQALALLATVAWSGLASWGILRLVALILPLRAAEKSERRGLDLVEHGEEAYGTGEGAILVLPRPEPPAAGSLGPILDAPAGSAAGA
jgi:Amt family ammonium transporter